MIAADRILLTGATGFIGRAVLDRLLANGHEVLALHSRADPNIAFPRLEWRHADLLSIEEAGLRALLSDSQISHCIHGAWYTQHPDYLVAEVNRDWVAASLRLARAFYDTGGARFIGCGTCVEYDWSEGGRLSEQATPLTPSTPYGRAKLEFSRALAGLGGDQGWARIFFVYGPGDRPGRLVPHILKQLRAGEKAAPRHGGAKRDYIHVEDLAGELAALSLSDSQGPVNVGSGEAVAIADIFRTTAELVGRPDLVETNARLPEAEPAVIEADLSRYRARLGEPQVRSFAEGLAALVASENADAA